MRISDWSSDVCSSDLRYEIERLNHSSWQIKATWGFKQEPNVPQMLEQLAQDMPEINLEPLEVSFFMSRQTVLVVRKLPLLARLQRRIFAFMARNATRSTRFYKIPPNRVVEKIGRASCRERVGQYG